jgi:hypothetical protein
MLSCTTLRSGQDYLAGAHVLPVAAQILFHHHFDELFKGDIRRPA